MPLTALMVVYTFIGLSITAEPITESRAPAGTVALPTDSVPIPPDAVLPEAASGRLQAVGPDRTARLRLAYKVLGSDFHDGTKTTGADLLYAYAFAYRWGVRDGGEGAHYDPFVDAARSVVLIDTMAWPAACLPYVPDSGYVAPSLDVTAQFHRAVPDSEWLLCEARAPIAQHGLIGGQTRVWSTDGKLVASGGGQLLCRPQPAGG